MISSRFAAVRFALQQFAEWCADYGFAILSAALLLAGAMALGAYALKGTPKPELAEVIRFGSYAHELGDKPVVLVRTRDGVIHQLMTSEVSTRNCRKGDIIRLIRRPHSLTVDPRGCMPQE